MENHAQYLNDIDLYYRTAFSRNIGLLTEQEQRRLRDFKVAIAGLGGVGGIHLLTLVRLGIGRFTITDGDTFEIANIQRQVGASMDTVGRNKAEVMKEIAFSINPHLELRVFPEGISAKNIDAFLEGVDIFVDGIEFFSIDTRRLIFSNAKKKGIYVLTAGPLGFGSALLIFSPQGMSFDTYFDINDRMSELEKLVAFNVGLAPAALHLRYFNLNSVDLNSKTGPSLVSACDLCSVFVATEVLNILLKRKKPKAVPFYSQFDPYAHKYKQGYLFWGNRNPVQKLKRWYLLKKFSSKRIDDSQRDHL